MHRRVVVLVHHVQRREEGVQPLDESEVVGEPELAEIHDHHVGRLFYWLLFSMTEIHYLK